MKNLSPLPSRAILLALTGFCAGCVNGLLGAGGGIIVVLAVSRIMSDTLKSKNDAFTVALCVMLPISLVSCLIYSLRKSMSADGFGVFLLPALVGGAIGGALLGKIKASAVKKLFSALVVLSGILMIVR